MDGDAIRARDRLLLAGIGAATVPATFDFDTGRDLRALFAFALPAVLTTAGDSLSASLPGPQVWRACDRGLVPLPWSNDAQNKREPSEDDCFAAPTAVGIHQGSSHGEC
jgi:hypothetical protein